MLIVAGTLTVAAEVCDQFAADCDQMARSGRDCAGCSFFSVAVEDALAGRFLVCEIWQTRPALDGFLNQPSSIAFFERWSQRMQSALRIFDVVEPMPSESEIAR